MTFPLDINQYQILERIGSGSTSQVYRAKCLTNNRIIAMKIIELELYPLEIDVLRREVAFWSRCHQNENIVDYHGSFINGSVLYILMEYLSGGSVLDIMREKFPNGFKDECQIATILKGILLALEYVHQHDQVHRDIKPGNVLINDEGTVKIGDFGVAASLLEEGRKRARYTVIGTLSYMAPEVLNKEISYTQKADIWSLGITAYEFATGSSPYQNFPPLSIVIQILKSPPPRLPKDETYSPELYDFVKVCLNHQTENRPTASTLLEHDFIKKAKDGKYLVETLLSQIPPLEQRSQRRQRIYEDLAPKPSNDSQSPPVWQFPSDNQSTQAENTNATEEKEESIEHKGRFNIHITKQSSSGLKRSSSDLISNSEQLPKSQPPLDAQKNATTQQQPKMQPLPNNQQKASIALQPEIPTSQQLPTSQTSAQQQPQAPFQQPTLQQPPAAQPENAVQAQPDSQQRKKNLRNQIADLSAKIEQLTRDNEQFRNQLKVITTRINLLVNKSKM